jgi:hypothetical protein
MTPTETAAIRRLDTWRLVWIIRDNPTYIASLRRTHPADTDWEAEIALYEEEIRIAKDELARRGEL